MGYAKFKRPILAPGITVSSGGVAGATGPGTVMGDLDVTGDLRTAGLTLSGGLNLAVESLGVSTALQTLSANGVSVLTLASSGAGRDFRLPAPTPGAFKLILVSNNTTSVDTIIFSNGTANTFFGTTYNQAALAAASTGSPGGTPAGTVSLLAVGVTTAQWALWPGSTFNWDLSASTGSTGQ